MVSKFAEEYTYLGCIFNQRISDISDLERITKSFNMSCRMFFFFVSDHSVIQTSHWTGIFSIRCACPFMAFIFSVVRMVLLSKLRELSVSYH